MTDRRQAGSPSIPCIGGPKDGTVQSADFFLLDDVISYDAAGRPHFTPWAYERATVNGRDVWLWRQQGPTT